MGNCATFAKEEKGVDETRVKDLADRSIAVEDDANREVALVKRKRKKKGKNTKKIDFKQKAEACKEIESGKGMYTFTPTRRRDSDDRA
jgi:hypothetical protein